MTNNPSVVFSNYEEYEVWFNQHMLIAWDEIGLPTHMHRSELNLSRETEIDKHTVLSFMKDKLKLEIACTEDITRATYEQFYAIGVCKEQGIAFGVSLEEGNLWYRVYTHEVALADKIAEEIKEHFKVAPEEEKKSKFAFWQMDEEGCRVQYSRLDCPTLTDLSKNYNPETFDEVNRVLNLDEPFKHGKIILWHGPPGNGKTYLIRAAAKHWIEKFDIVPEVIIDPQQLFGYSKYLTTLLLRRTAKKKQPFRLFIAEDCAQLFSSAGRRQEGFDRLLNIADGLLGQGQKIVFLFTANEKIEDIDPAILRPGRCLQNVLVDNWKQEEARKWLDQRGILEKYSQNVQNGASLAELYAMLNGVIPAKQHKNNNFGFKN